MVEFVLTMLICFVTGQVSVGTDGVDLVGIDYVIEFPCDPWWGTDPANDEMCYLVRYEDGTTETGP